MKRNIAIAGGPCTGKSTTAAALFAKLKELGLDYDFVDEQSRSLKKEFGTCRSPFDRFYMWRRQEREEKRSSAGDGFVTDAPLFQLYAQAVFHSKEPRDVLAVRELLRMCRDVESNYDLVVMAGDVEEIPYKKDKSRTERKKGAREKHRIIKTYVEHFLPNKILYVRGTVSQRVRMIVRRLKELRGETKKKKRL